jgi:argininosuccinate lyase
MTHLSRLAEELVWWSHPAFGFVRLADAWSTGSSMMPNKRNPDPAELIRGRTARVDGHLLAALTLLKGLPAGYQRDLQEDKPGLFDALEVLASSLGVMRGVVATLVVDEERMRRAATAGFTTATAVADALVERGVPFREAHHIVGSLVARAEATGAGLSDLADADILEGLSRSADPAAVELARTPGSAEELRAAATLEHALGRPDVVGGTAPRRVHAELLAAAARLGLEG